MKRLIYSFLLLVFLQSWVNAQIINGLDTLYGNEWIDFSKSYFKISLAEDGIYRVTRDDLQQAGFPINSVPGNQLQLFLFGEETHIYTSTSGIFGSGDYLEFYGRKNRAELDQYLYEDGYDDLLNPEFSLFNDTTAYFLTWDESGSANRYEEVENNLVGLPPVEPYYLASEKLVFTDFHFKPTYNGTDQIRFSSFDYSEGFGSPLVVSTSFSFNPTEIDQTGPDPVLNFRMGTNTVAHIIELKINNELQTIYDFSGYNVNSYSEEFDHSLLTATTTIQLEGTTTTSDRNSVSYAEIIYPRKYIASPSSGSFTALVKADLFKKYVELEGFSNNGEVPVVYDITNKIRIEAFFDTNDGKVKIVFPPSNEDRTIIIINDNNTQDRSFQFKGINFRDFREDQDVNYFIISNELLFEEEGTGINWVQEYADYRSSIDGGSFTTSIAQVRQLYDQFAYGIDRHAISLRNFVHYIKKHLDVDFLFIIGKGREYSTTRFEEDLTSENGKRFFVPTYGVPGSDNLIASVKGKTTPLIPIGRLAASTTEDISQYLDKVKIHENPISDLQTIEDQYWKKKILHLSGGDPSIQQTLFNYLSDMATIIRNNLFGGRVTTFRKTTSDPIQTATTENIIKEINAGVSILSFFGHSAVGTFDFSLEEPGEYENTGKYPLIISLGCHSGNIHSGGIGLSEAFVLEKNKGAIAFLASSGTAYISPQYNSGKDFYDFTGDEYYGESIGKILQEAIRKRDVTQSLSVKTLNEQLTLHGDPAITLYPKQGPDYTLDFKSVTTEPSIVSTNLDSFRLSFDIINLGLNIADSLDVLVEHYLADNTLAQSISMRIMAPANEESIELFLPVGGVNYIGKNTIRILLDQNNKITELPNPDAELNNTLKADTGEDYYCFYILDNGAKPVSPLDLSIHSKGEVTLVASTSNAYLETQKYLFELDTTELFDSPLLETTTIEQTGGLLRWKPEFNFQQGVSYYWRVSPDSVNTNVGYIWENSSFVYLPTSSEGWNQSHYYQMVNNDFDGIRLDEAQRIIVYDTLGFFINLRNGIWDGASVGYQFNFGNFATSVRPWNFMEEGVAIVVGDSLTGSAWTNSGGEFGSINTTNFGSFRVFGYNTNTPEERSAVINMLENEIPDNNFVFFWTVLRSENADFSPEEWASDEQINGKSIFSVLEDQGASIIRELEQKGSIPYNFIYKKGVNALEEEIAEDKFDLVVTDVFIPTKSTNGSMKSPLIGPAKKWTNLLWDENNKEVQDESHVNIYGLNEALTDTTLLYENILEHEFFIDGVDATEFPYLIIEYYSSDDEKRTSPNLLFWRVLYDGLPEVGLNPSILSEFHRDTLQQGDTFRFRMAAENLSCFADLDSLLVKYTLTDEENISEILYERLRALPKTDTLHLEFQKNTTDMLGSYQFTVEINPDNDQKETYKFNNFGIREFLVDIDKKNPLLDVTFDGLHILDGDIVSSNPYILIDLKDENSYFQLDNIELFELALEKPDGSIWNIDYNDPALLFTPANDDENRARLEFTPILEEEGEYKLIVQAKDKSGNFSGNNAYEINFRVILSQTISNVLNYPNPFSTSTQFIFTLTGNEIPEYFKIQILSLSGKVVKEITKNELGPMNIGVNRTEYKWDGTDDYGNKLANGVYLYKVDVKNSATEDYDHFETSADSFFKRGLGKLVILR